MPPAALPRLALIALLFSVLLPTPAAAAEKHQIAMERQRQVGDKYGAIVQAERKQSTKQVLNGKESADTQLLAGSMTVVVEVLEVDQNKRAKKAAVKVDAFDAKLNGQPVKLDTTRRIIVSVNNGKETYTYEDGGALTPQATDAFSFLGEFIVAEDADKPLDAKVFKLEQPREVGTSWQCDHRLLASSFSNDDISVEESDIDSEFEFLETAQLNGQQAAVYDVSIVMKKLAIPGGKEKGITITKSSGEMTNSGVLPMDPRSANGAMKITMKMNIVANAQGPGGKVDIIVNAEMKARARFRQLQ